MRTKSKIVCLILVIMFISIGATNKLLIFSGPMINLNVLVMDSIGGGVDSTSDIDVLDTDEDTQSVVEENSYIVRVRGRAIFWNNVTQNSLSNLEDSMRNSGVESDVTVILIDDYADAEVYKNVRELILNTCELEEKQWVD